MDGLPWEIQNLRGHQHSVPVARRGVVTVVAGRIPSHTKAARIPGSGWPQDPPQLIQNTPYPTRDVKGKWFLNPWWWKFFRDMKLKNKKYDTDGDKRLSQKGKSGETDGNMPSRWSNDIIDTDISPVESFPWSQLCEMRKTLEKPVKSKKLDS